MSKIINKITVTNRWRIRVSRAVIRATMIKLHCGQTPPNEEKLRDKSRN